MMTGPELTLAEALGVTLATNDDTHPLWLIAVAAHLTPPEILDATEMAMRLLGVPEVWIELTRDENMAAARTLSQLPWESDDAERN